ncbi:hypothetical protein RB595_004929 [Gaeumannomyces hyphopodioides]
MLGHVSTALLALSLATAPQVLAAAGDDVIFPTPAAILEARATAGIGDCYAQSPYMKCITPHTSQTCGKPGDGPSATACACGQVTALWNCYTSACSSDNLYSTFYAGISVCNAQGFGGASPVTAAGQGGGGGNGAAGATATAGGAGAASTNKNAGAAARPGFVGAVIAFGVAAWAA